MITEIKEIADVLEDLHNNPFYDFSDRTVNGLRYKNALLKAIKFLKNPEKASEPKKLKNIRVFRDDEGCLYNKGTCPCCGDIIEDRIYEDIRFCYHCGQAIEWGSEKECPEEL